jgi:phage terminase large subunit-like protein
MTLTGLRNFPVVRNEYLYRKRIHPINFFSPLLEQIKFFEDKAKFKVIFGGNRSSKTTTAAYYVVKKCEENPNMKCWCVAETFQDSVAIQQRKIWDFTSKDRIKYGSYDVINGFTNRKLLFDNGSLITFKSYDQKREAFQGENCDLIHNDEEVPYDIFQEQRMRLVDNDGEMLLTMTALKGMTELIDELFEGYTTIESKYAELVNETLPTVAEKNGVKFFFFHTTDNPYINQRRLKEDLKLMTHQEIKTRIYGIPTNLSGKIYPGFNKRVHVVEMDDVPDGRWCLWNVLDPHDRKPWAIGWYAIHQTGTIYQVDEYPNRDFNEMLSDDKTYDDYAVLIKQKEEDLKEIFGVSVSKRIIDPNFGNKTVQLAERQGGQSKTTPRKELEKRGLKYTDGIDALEAGHLKVREFLAWKEKDGQITYQPRFFVVSHCANSITHLSRYSRKDIAGADGDVKDKVAPMDKYKDFCDLTRYLCMANPRFIVPQEFKQDTRKAY